MGRIDNLRAAWTWLLIIIGVALRATALASEERVSGPAYVLFSAEPEVRGLALDASGVGASVEATWVAGRPAWLVAAPAELSFLVEDDFANDNDATASLRIDYVAENTADFVVEYDANDLAARKAGEAKVTRWVRSVPDEKGWRTAWLSLPCARFAATGSRPDFRVLSRGTLQIGRIQLALGHVEVRVEPTVACVGQEVVIAAIPEGVVRGQQPVKARLSELGTDGQQEATARGGVCWFRLAADRPRVALLQVLCGDLYGEAELRIIERGPVSPRTETLETFDKYESSRLAGTQRDGCVVSCAVEQGTRDACLRLDYSASNPAAEYHNVELRIGRVFSGRPHFVTLWVFGDGTRNRLRVRLRDASGEYFQFNFAYLDQQPTAGHFLDFTEWRHLGARLDDGNVQANWGGDADGLVDDPWELVSLLLDFDPQTSGTLYFDDLALSRTGPP